MTVASPADTPQAGEVVVSGKHKDPTATTLNAAEARRVPGALDDPLRAISALPGITPIQSANPLFFVRGAAPGNNRFFLDGISVPLLFHAGLGPSVVAADLIQSIEFFPSAAPVTYGRFLGGAVAAETRGPAAEPRLVAGVRLIDANALVEAPFADGRGSALVAGRYGYPDLALALVARSTRLHYWDYQARLNYQLGNHDEISAFWFGSRDQTEHIDDFGQVENVQEELASEFHVLDLRYDHTFHGGRLRVAATLGKSKVGAAPFYAKDAFAGVRAEFEDRLAPQVLLRAGSDARFDAYTIERDRANPLDAIVPSSADPPPRDTLLAAHADAVWTPGKALEVTPGLRFDLYDSMRPGLGAALPALEPRLSARVRLAEPVALLGAVALTHQMPDLRVGTAPGSVASVPGFASEHPRLQTAVEMSQGVEVRLPADITLKTTGFYSRFSELTDLTQECRAITTGPAFPPPPPTGFACADAPTSGRAYGLEVYLRRSLTRRLGGWLSYTLSRATRTASFGAPGQEVSATVPSEFDRTHVLNLIGAYDLGRHWTLGGRFVFYTGQPYTLTANGVPQPPFRGHRFASYERVDVRLEKRWRLGDDGCLSFLLEGQNVTRSQEASSLRCQSSGTNGVQDQCAVETTATVIPSIGLSIEL